MSDLHGADDQLGQILEHINRLYPTDKQFIFLGDYIDRGPKSRELLDRLISMDDGHNIFLRGNHDDMALGLSPNYQNGLVNGFQNWMQNGGDKTLLSYGYEFTPQFWKLPTEEMLKEAYETFSSSHRDWLLKHPYFYKDEQRTYVHAGFYRDKPIEEQHYHVLTWIREEFMNDKRPDGGYVVHGHTPTIMYYSREPALVDVCHNRCNIDTGAVYGGVLSAAIFNETRPGPIALLNHLGQHTEIK